MKNIIICIIYCITFTSSLTAQSKNSKHKAKTEQPKPTEESRKNNDETTIRTLLAAQVAEWNKGNIEGYMAGYWENDSMLFIGSKGPRYGYTKTLERYKEAYPDPDHMGKLISTISKLEQLSKEYYFVVGKWELKRNAGDVNGSFTLLIKKIDGKWVIICDHSS